jgi:RNA polymerase sigma factor (sigma-70 family)
MAFSTDNQQLQEYAISGSDAAFHCLVREHLPMVFATACRQLGSRALAEEVAQDVFLSLARKSASIANHRTIAGWLHQSTLLECRHCLRTELRHRHRERMALEIGTFEPSGDGLLKPLVPILDDALLSLAESDRTVVLLRFLENKSLREVGAVLGISEDAARKRVDKALNLLTRFFRRQGFAVPAATLVPGLFTAATHAAPVGMTESILAAGGKSVGSGFIQGVGVASAEPVGSSFAPSKALILMATTKSKSAVISIVGLLLVGASLVVHQIYTHSTEGELRSGLRGGMTPEEFARLKAISSPTLRMIQFAGDHNDSFPRTVRDLGEPLLRPDGTPEDWSELEMVGPPSLKGLTNPSTTVILQEKRPDKNGKRVRAYADGHSDLRP